MGGVVRSCLASFFPSPDGNGQTFWKGVWWDSDGRPVRSVYDVLADGSDPARPLAERQSLEDAVLDGRRGRTGFFEDDLVTCFVPRDPSSVVHLLVVPREHIRNTSHLDPSKHLPVLEHMRAVGEQQLRLCASRLGVPIDSPVFIFHVPPFNSIDHLHLHCHLPPFDSRLKRWKYAPGTCWCRSYSDIRRRLLE